MKNLTYVLSISLLCGSHLNAQLPAPEAGWTAEAFWQEAVLPCLNELRQDILPGTINFDWLLFRVFLKKHFIENKVYPHDDQVLKSLLDRWYELCQAERLTATILV